MPVTDPRGNGAVQLVVTDLDGTLSDAAERIHPASVQAIRDLEAGGVPVLVATGRRLRMACAVLEAAGLSPCVYVDREGVDLVVGDHPSTHPDHLARAMPWVAVDDLAGVVAAEPVYAFAVVGRPAPLLEPVLQLVGTAGSASLVGDLIYGGSTIQVRPPEISKWSGVLAYCAEQGIDPGRVLAVGDGAHDLELLEGAAVACAVATAPPVVLARADHVIGPPSSGGWAAVLDLAPRPVGAPDPGRQRSRTRAIRNG